MTAPRLNTIDGLALGGRLVETYMQALRARSIHSKIERSVSASILFERAVDELARYARGDGPLEASRDEHLQDVEHHLLKITPLLEHPFGQSLPPVIGSAIWSTIEPDALNLGDAVHELALVIAAALGRQAIHLKPTDRIRSRSTNYSGHVRLCWLAALASCSLKTVERAKLTTPRRGLRLQRGWTTAPLAQAWLAGRTASEDSERKTP